MAVQTVLGVVERNDLGIISPHEHIMIDLGSFFKAHPVRGCVDPASAPVVIENLGVLMRDPYALLDNLLLNDPVIQKTELLYFKNAGGKTIVDATMPGIGRDALILREISRETKLHVIMGTGFYIGTTHPEYLSDMPIDEIADEMIKELEVGIDDTGIKAGFIGEIGISEVFDDRERRVLKAAAIAQIHTDVAIHVHINPWTTNGLEASDILLNAGVPANRINICHVDVENREDYILKLLHKGIYIEFDNFGKEYFVDEAVRNSGYGPFVTDVERVRLLKKLIDMGYEKQLLLSCDVCLKILLHQYGGWGYDHVLTNIVPMMKEYGISDQQIQQIIVNNPVNFIDGPES